MSTPRRLSLATLITLSMLVTSSPVHSEPTITQPLISRMAEIDDPVLNEGTALPPLVQEIVSRVQGELQTAIPVYMSGFTRYAQAGQHAVFISPYLLSLLTEEELTFILLHEMSHVIHEDGKQLLTRGAADAHLPLAAQYDNLTRLSFELELLADRFAIAHGLSMGLSKAVMRNALTKVVMDNNGTQQRTTHPDLITRLRQIDQYPEP